MKDVVVANAKGGCGKTTLATHIACHFSQRGGDVLLADHDPQQSSLDWLNSRPNRNFSIQGQATIKSELKVRPNVTVIHDTAAGINPKSLIELCRGHKLLIPILPSPTDIKAALRFLMALNREGLNDSYTDIDVALVANRVRENTRYFKVLQAFLRQLNMPLLASLRDTQNYIHALDRGVSIFDFPPSRVARDKESWNPILDWLNH